MFVTLPERLFFSLLELLYGALFIKRSKIIFEESLNLWVCGAVVPN
jgi:hypothetical protein